MDPVSMSEIGGATSAASTYEEDVGELKCKDISCKCKVDKKGLQHLSFAKAPHIWLVLFAFLFLSDMTPCQTFHLMRSCQGARGKKLDGISISMAASSSYPVTLKQVVSRMTKMTQNALRGRNSRMQSWGLLGGRGPNYPLLFQWASAWSMHTPMGMPQR